MENFLFRTKQISIIKALRNNLSVNKLRKQTDTNYSYMLKIINMYEKIGLIETKRKGRERLIFITNKGLRVRKLINEILENLR